MTYILAACQLFTALIFLMSTTGKVLYPDQFMKALRATSIPQRALLPLALSTITIEFILAVGLIFTWSLFFTWIGIIALLAIFTIWMLWMYFRKISLQCGCFGSNDSAIGTSSIMRNIVFIVIASLGLYLTSKTNNLLPSSSFWITIIATVFVGGILFLTV